MGNESYYTELENVHSKNEKKSGLENSLLCFPIEKTYTSYFSRKV